MSVFWQTILIILAVVGLCAILRVMFELLFARLLRQRSSAELTLYGDGCDASAEQLLRAAMRIRRHYLPGMTITFVEIGDKKGQNLAKHLSACSDIMYLD